MLALATATPAKAQTGRGEPGAEAGVSPAEIQRLFDAYVLMQAQNQLKLSDDQYAQFLPRFRALQETRRRALIERVRVVQNLRRLANDPQSNDGDIRDQLNALQDVEARTMTDVRKAHDAVDQTLDTRQQARFRLFEENMERRKLELVARARQANRARRQQ
jgi:hypothetical protein